MRNIFLRLRCSLVVRCVGRAEYCTHTSNMTPSVPLGGTVVIGRAHDGSDVRMPLYGVGTWTVQDQRVLHDVSVRQRAHARTRRRSTRRFKRAYASSTRPSRTIITNKLRSCWQNSCPSTNWPVKICLLFVLLWEYSVFVSVCADVKVAPESTRTGRSAKGCRTIAGRTTNRLLGLDAHSLAGQRRCRSEIDVERGGSRWQLE
jgi:hypothetical protein